MVVNRIEESGFRRFRKFQNIRSLVRIEYDGWVRNYLFIFAKIPVLLTVDNSNLR